MNLRCMVDSVYMHKKCPCMRRTQIEMTVDSEDSLLDVYDTRRLKRVDKHTFQRHFCFQNALIHNRRTDVTNACFTTPLRFETDRLQTQQCAAGLQPAAVQMSRLYFVGGVGSLV